MKAEARPGRSGFTDATTRTPFSHTSFPSPKSRGRARSQYSSPPEPIPHSVRTLNLPYEAVPLAQRCRRGPTSFHPRPQSGRGKAPSRFRGSSSRPDTHVEKSALHLRASREPGSPKAVSQNRVYAPVDSDADSSRVSLWVSLSVAAVRHDHRVFYSRTSFFTVLLKSFRKSSDQEEPIPDSLKTGAMARTTALPVKWPQRMVPERETGVFPRDSDVAIGSGPIHRSLDPLLTTLFQTARTSFPALDSRCVQPDRRLITCSWVLPTYPRA